MLSELAPVGNPGHHAILRLPVRVERGNDLTNGIPALAVLACDAAQGALRQFVEVVLDVTDGAADGACQ